jgi:hypothetical protein
MNREYAAAAFLPDIGPPLFSAYCLLNTHHEKKPLFAHETRQRWNLRLIVSVYNWDEVRRTVISGRVHAC